MDEAGSVYMVYAGNTRHFKRFRRKPYMRSLLLTVQNMSERTDGMWKRVYNEKE